MKKKTFLALAIAALLSMSACAPAQPSHHTEHVKIVHTKDGRWAYHDDSSDIWFWYVLTSTNNATYQAALTSGSAPAGLPSGGAWVKGTAPTQEELAEAETIEADLDVTESGEPAIEAETVEAAEAGEISDATADVSADVGGDASGSVDAGSFDGGGGGDSGG